MMLVIIAGERKTAGGTHGDRRSDRVGCPQ